jgi:hypothetical protein
MNPDPNQPLQFDKADFAGQPTLACASCKAPISSEYYQVNGKVICPTCRDTFTKFGVAGVDPGRVALALVVAIVAGIVGFVVYGFLTALIHANLSLLSIAVGWLVGTAVRWASKHRGGPIYQAIALVITYISVCCAVYLPSFNNFWQSLGQALIEPWTEGFSNIIGWLIIAFALYEAWMLNRKVRLDITGPFFTRQAPPPAAS